MTTDRRLVVAALVLVAVAAVAPTLVSSRPANEVPVASMTGNRASSLADPTGEAWNDAIPVEVALASAPSTVPNASETSVEAVDVRAARTQNRLFVRLSWHDGTEDGNVSPSPSDAPTVRSFADAAAIQVPVNTSTRPGIAMGSPRSQVNVWYWNPEVGGQELLAGGPGTTTRFQSPAVSTAATYSDDEWHVVFSRPIAADSANRTSFAVERDVSVAFAVWNGSNMERSGRKAVSDWHHFPFGPGPQGPPYEAILWTIAGLAILVVVVVTAMAMRGS